MPRVIVYGCGSIGRRHIRNLLALGCNVWATDSDAAARERARSEYPNAYVFGWASGLDLFDAAVIATPLDQHLIYIERELVERRQPTFIEKPIGSLKQLPRLREIAAMELPTNQIGYNWRFNREVAAFEQRISNSWLDRIARIWLFCHTDMKTWPGKSYGDPLLECSHEIDLAARGFNGLPVEFSIGQMKPRLNSSLSDWDLSGAWLAFDGEPNINVSIDWSGFRQSGRTYVAEDEDGNKFCSWNISQASIDESYVDEMRHFLECAREGKPTNCTIVDGLKVLDICARVTSPLKVHGSV